MPPVTGAVFPDRSPTSVSLSISSSKIIHFKSESDFNKFFFEKDFKISTKLALSEGVDNNSRELCRTMDDNIEKLSRSVDDNVGELSRGIDDNVGKLCGSVDDNVEKLSSGMDDNSGESSRGLYGLL